MKCEVIIAKHGFAAMDRNFEFSLDWTKVPRDVANKSSMAGGTQFLHNTDFNKSPKSCNNRTSQLEAITI